MALLDSNNPSPFAGTLGPTGVFSSQPGQEITQLGQVGEPLQFGSEQSPTGLNPNYQNSLKALQGVSSTPNLGFGQSMQAGNAGKNSIPSFQAHSSAMSPPTPQSLLQALGNQ